MNRTWWNNGRTQEQGAPGGISHEPVQRTECFGGEECGSLFPWSFSGDLETTQLIFGDTQKETNKQKKKKRTPAHLPLSLEQLTLSGKLNS